jgi:hypothetical protein
LLPQRRRRSSAALPELIGLLAADGGSKIHERRFTGTSISSMKAISSATFPTGNN